MCQNNTYSFYKIFQKLVQNYNSKVHSALKISPAAAEQNENQSHVLKMHMKNFKNTRNIDQNIKLDKKLESVYRKLSFQEDICLTLVSIYIYLNL